MDDFDEYYSWLKTILGHCPKSRGKYNLKRSTLRLTYAYHEDENKIYFIEIYFKGDKENEDRERIKEYLKEMEVK